ncbi:hypothetical protein [Desulfogranum mediterraneum]|uniref:hypothetical protein n=1 Tax=Desulfogranum mediterraneum TaxID=160661 RepID=UPI00041C198C|nr:hypothetical protein [Desulfogranum mediterraneum]
MSLQYTPAIPASQLRTPWLEQRRNYFIRQVISDFFQVNQVYYRLYLQYRTSSAAPSAGCRAPHILLSPGSELGQQLLAELTALLGSEHNRGVLWRLKDVCHRIWPESEREHNLAGSLVDWLIGSLFHEAMKLKENIYLLNHYGPVDFPVNREGGGVREEGSLFPLAQLLDTQGLFQRIAADSLLQMEQVGLLLGQASYLLRLMMPSLADNELVVRCLSENEGMILDIWGEPLEAVFSEMFSGQPAQGYCVAGRSYFNDQWYQRAKEMYQRAKEIDRYCSEAVIKLAQLERITRDGAGSFGRDSG